MEMKERRSMDWLRKTSLSQEPKDSFHPTKNESKSREKKTLDIAM